MARRRKRHARYGGVKLLQLADGRHVARWRDPFTGKQKQQSLAALGLTNDALRRQWREQKAEHLQELRRNLSLGSSTPTIMAPEQARDEWLATQDVESTKKSRRYVLRAFLAWLAENGVTSMTDLQPQHLARWRQFVMSPTREYAPITRSRWLQVTGSWLRWCTELELAPRLSLDAISRMAKKPRMPSEEPVILRPAEVRRVLEAAIEHDQNPKYRDIAPFTLALLLTGCRYHELATVQWCEIDFGDECIRLPAARTKTRRARLISWRETPALGKLLEILHAEGASGPVFGWHYTSFCGARNRLVERHGSPKFSPHDLRRTCAAALVCAPAIYQSASHYLTAARLGHDVGILTRRYASLMRDLPEARTLEGVLGIEDLAEQIVGRCVAGAGGST